MYYLRGDHFYETKIAKQLADAYALLISNYFHESDLWPTRNELLSIVKYTESASVSAWNTILKKLERDYDNCIILGDMCESIPGRNIKSYSSRGSRIKRFIPSLLGRPQAFTISTKNSFINWQEDKINHLRNQLINTEVFSNTFSSNMNIIDECLEDILTTTRLIRNHDIRFSELYDELFEWYIHARLPMGKQLTIFGNFLDGICPSMGLMAIRTVSKIHPALRLDYKFMDRFMKSIVEFGPSLKIPTAQAPFIPYYFPNSLKLLVWGLRSKVDNMLIARMVRNKNHKLRYRILSSINWPDLYHVIGASTNLESYFVEDFYHIKEMCMRRFNNRALLDEWPLSNNDIINLAALNMEIELILSEH